MCLAGATPGCLGRWWSCHHRRGVDWCLETSCHRCCHQQWECSSEIPFMFDYVIIIDHRLGDWRHVVTGLSFCLVKCGLDCWRHVFTYHHRWGVETWRVWGEVLAGQLSGPDWAACWRLVVGWAWRNTAVEEWLHSRRGVETSLINSHGFPVEGPTVQTTNVRQV